MYCQHCGAQAPEGARFCAYCGKALAPQAGAPPPTTPIAAAPGMRAGQAPRRATRRTGLVVAGWIVAGLGVLLTELCLVVQLTQPQGPGYNVTGFILVLMLCPLPLLFAGVVMLIVGARPRRPKEAAAQEAAPRAAPAPTQGAPAKGTAVAPAPKRPAAQVAAPPPPAVSQPGPAAAASATPPAPRSAAPSPAPKPTAPPAPRSADVSPAPKPTAPPAPRSADVSPAPKPTAPPAPRSADVSPARAKPTAPLASLCAAYKEGRCVIRGRDTGPCTWDAANWGECNVVQDKLAFYGSWDPEGVQ